MAWFTSWRSRLFWNSAICRSFHVAAFQMIHDFEAIPDHFSVHHVILWRFGLCDRNCFIHSIDAGPFETYDLISSETEKDIKGQTQVGSVEMRLAIQHHCRIIQLTQFVFGKRGVFPITGVIPGKKRFCRCFQIVDQPSADQIIIESKRLDLIP